MKLIIELSEYNMQQCALFSHESALTQQRVEFGQKTTKERPLAEIARDNMIGKMGEVAFQKFLYQRFGIKTPVNFDIYPRGDCDNIDVGINGWGIDVKTTRYGNNLLYERNKLEYRRKSETIPDALVVCKVAWNKDRDTPAKRTVELIGCISTLNMINPKNKDVELLEKGEYIPCTRTPLQADNYVVGFNRLSDIEKSVEYMLKNRPIRRMAV